MTPSDLFFQEKDSYQVMVQDSQSEACNYCEIFDTWLYYSESYKYEALTLKNHNHLRQTMQKKGLNSQYV